MDSLIIDPKSVAGKFPRPEQHVGLLVVGAGPAGIAAALEGARRGQSVLLVDEHPVAAGMAALDVPFCFGGRASPAIANQARMMEQIASAIPGLEAVFEAGVEVMLGVSVWGAWTRAPGLQSLPCPIAGLATEERSWLCGFDAAVIAAGARDLVLSFAGSDQPGVMGAQALQALLVRYQAFSGRRVILLGSGRLALETALLALDHGIEVAALIEARDTPQGPDALVAALRARGVEVICGHVPLRAECNVEGVVALHAMPVGAGEGRRIECDTICLALGVVPSVELLDVLGVPLVMDPGRGGYVPTQDENGLTPVAGIAVAGDCAGLGGDAAAQGARAAKAVLLGAGYGRAIPPGVDDGSFSCRMDWMRLLLATGGADVLACTCEEVTRAELLGVRPPRYLGCAPDAGAARDLATLLRDGPVDHDQLKRLTRVSMGPCQARRCREQVAMLLAIGAGIEAGGVRLAGYRAPVRPLTLQALSAPDDAASQAGWDVWFGIAAQWVPYADIGTPREAEALGDDMHL